MIFFASSKNGKRRASSHADCPTLAGCCQNLVSLILKTHKEEDVDGRSLSKFIHQAIVRRDVVVRLIDNARRRGHRAYRDIDMAQVRAKAERELPENDAPACVVALTELDDLTDKHQVPKAATPVRTATSAPLARRPRGAAACRGPRADEYAPSFTSRRRRLGGLSAE